MVQILVLVVLVLLPFSADAAYKVYLKNGSVIPGVSSYEKTDGEVTIYFGGGSMGVPERDILKIEETGAPEQDFRAPQTPGVREEGPAAAPPSVESGNRAARREVLRNELDSVTAEIRAVESEEARIVQAINDRKGARLSYNTLQLRQLESDLAPLQQELSAVQMRKGALLQRRSSIDSELQSLE